MRRAKIEEGKICPSIGKIFHNKRDTFTVEGVNADVRCYIPTLARRSRRFPRKKGKK